MLLTTQSSDTSINSEHLGPKSTCSKDVDVLSFVEDVVGDDNIRVDENFGHGYVRLKSSEAQKRQAAQDIRSSEDILIELLRNARDADANNIFVATSKTNDLRHIIVIDDGVGIPLDMFGRIFEPRVTSKLDTAHMDKWGMHGRGMALYSIAVNSKEACVMASDRGMGSSIRVLVDCASLGEKTDQSTFPRFEFSDGVYSMRGPKNLIRTTAEFALEHKSSVNVFFGSPIDIASTLYEYGCSTIQPAKRAYKALAQQEPLFKRLSFASDPAELAVLSAEMGLDISERSARRIMDGQIDPLDTMVDRIKKLSFSFTKEPSVKLKRKVKRQETNDQTMLASISIDSDDKALFSDALKPHFEEFAEKYYLESDVEPSVKVSKGRLIVEYPLIQDNS